MGPRPAVAEVRRAVRTALTWPPSRDFAGASPGYGANVMVACSGGADSLALAAAVAFEAPRAGVNAGLITVDHGLQDGSAVQAARVAQLGYDLGLDPVEIIRVDVGRARGPEAAARTARYAALDATADALNARILLGHTLDDQAETVLLGLGRGSGPGSIAGMRAVDGRYLRPLLGIRRATTGLVCRELGLEVWDDPHNADPRYQRVRLRTEVLPLLEDVLQGGVAEALARTATLIRDDLDALDTFINRSNLAPQQGDSPAEPLLGGQVGSDRALDTDDLVDQPRAVRTRRLKIWAHAHGAGSLEAIHLRAMDELIMNWHGQGPIQLPGGVSVRRTSGRLYLQPTHLQPTLESE